MSPLKNSEVRKLVVNTLIGLAIGGNGYFIKRLVDKIDRLDHIERKQIEMGSDIRVIKWQLGIAVSEPFGNELQSKRKEKGS